MSDKYAYRVGENLYINLTNRCSNACGFCIRNGGGDLWLEREPTSREVIDALLQMRFQDFGEAVFCGFGEPTYRVDEIVEVGGFLKSKGLTVRLNTNGHGNLIHGRDITGELCGAVDIVSISLNRATAAAYQEECRSMYGERAFDAVLEFARLCVHRFSGTVMSVVDVIPAAEIEACREIAASVGAEFRVRKYSPSLGG